MNIIFSQKNKKILISISSAAGILLLIYLYFFSPDVQLLKSGQNEKIIEASNIHIIGWENNKRSWEIRAEKASSTKGQQLTELDGVYDGSAFKDGKLIIKKLKASKVNLTSYNHLLEAFSGKMNDSSSFLSAYIDLAGLASSKETQSKKHEPFAYVTAKHLVYNTEQKKTSADNSNIYDKRYTAFSEILDIDHRSDTAVMKGSPKVKAGSQTITAMTIESNYRDEKLKANENVLVQINKNKMRSSVKGDTLVFSTRDYNGQMNGHIRFSQKSKTAFSDLLSFDDKTQKAVLTGNVKTVMNKAGSILKESTIARIRNATAKQILKEGTLLTCDRLEVSTGNGDASAEGNVVVKQKDKIAKADSAFYNDNSETITLSGNVYIQKGSEWIKTKKVIVSVKKETFEAIGQVESVFKLKKQH